MIKSRIWCGCFWHRHAACRFATTPATRPEFWQEKFARNVERDQRSLGLLREKGWRTAVIWECELRQGGAPVVGKLLRWIESGRMIFEET